MNYNYINEIIFITLFMKGVIYQWVILKNMTI